MTGGSIAFESVADVNNSLSPPMGGRGSGRGGVFALREALEQFDTAGPHLTRRALRATLSPPRGRRSLSAPKFVRSKAMVRR